MNHCGQFNRHIQKHRGIESNELCLPVRVGSSTRGQVNNVGAEITGFPTCADPMVRCGNPLGARYPSMVGRGDGGERCEVHDTHRIGMRCIALPEFAGLTLYVASVVRY